MQGNDCVEEFSKLENPKEEQPEDIESTQRELNKTLE